MVHTIYFDLFMGLGLLSIWLWFAYMLYEIGASEKSYFIKDLLIDNNKIYGVFENDMHRCTSYVRELNYFDIKQQIMLMGLEKYKDYYIDGLKYNEFLMTDRRCIRMENV